MSAFFVNPTRRALLAFGVVASGLLACAAPARDAESRPDRDDYGTPVDFARPAERIVSLNPTTTEVLFALGASARLVGRSRWDTWPAQARAVPEVGDALRPSVERVLAARPTHVVLYASGDNRAAAAALGAQGISVIALKIDRIADFSRGVRMLGRLSGTDSAARAIVDSVDASLSRVRGAMVDVVRPDVFVHVWDNPLMTVGGGSYLSELLEIAGARNVYADLDVPSGQVSFEDLLVRDPDVVLAGPEVAARIAADPRWRTLRAVREGRVLAYDTSLVARPSMRLGEAAHSLAALLHPERRVP